GRHVPGPAGARLLARARTTDDGRGRAIDFPGDLRGRRVRGRVRGAGLLMHAASHPASGTRPSAADANGSPVISVRGLVNRFGPQVVHDGVDLDVYPGEVLGIVGGSGSGKSV